MCPSIGTPPRSPRKGQEGHRDWCQLGHWLCHGLELARHGADVVLACRNEERGLTAVQKIEEELMLSPDAGHVELRKLDVSSLASVQAFVDDVKSDNDRLDLLISNAGILSVPYAETIDGNESTFATNHLGHFALTLHLLPLLQNSDHARIVNVSSMAHKAAWVDANEIMTPKIKYFGLAVYSNTKLYNLLFTLELNRRFQAKGITTVMATTVHPGFTSTNLSEELFADVNWVLRLLLTIIWKLPVVQATQFGALPTLFAAVGENVKPNDLIGPDGFLACSGYPTKEEPTNVSKVHTHATALWEESERLIKSI